MTIAEDTTSRQMDSGSKILHHEDWLEKWKKDPLSVYPIYVEATPVGYCNHRCVFCAFDYIGYKNISLSGDVLKKVAKEMAEGGVKAIQYAGEGEPLLHPEIADIIRYTADLGIEVSMLTNGVLLREKFVNKTIKSLLWFQVSLDAGTKETHSKIHQTSEKDFGTILKNLSYAVKERNRQKSSCDIGVQFIILPGNFKELVRAVEVMKETGVDYITIKPYSHHLLSLHSKEEVLKEGFNYTDLLYLENDVKKIAGTDLAVDFRTAAMDEIETERNYNRCYATPTAWAYISADGSVYSCSAFLGDDRFNVGNINDNSFSEIWMSEKRKKHLEMMKGFDINSNCRRICRMNRTNRTLFSLRNPPSRVNFI
ncbi:radical SAM protein [Patescibacteria group bacterium]